MKLICVFKVCFIVLLSIILPTSASSQPVAKRFATTPWDAQWIAHPSSKLKDYEVYHFRKNFDLSEIPKEFIIHLSADSRYKLYVNGKMVGLGPVRSDLEHWYFDTYDLTSFLHTGKNSIAALVWNQGEWNALAQHSHRTAFVLQGNSAAEALVNTNKQWKVLKNEAYNPVIYKPVDPRLFWQYYVAGALDSVQAKHYPWQWEQTAYNDDAWVDPKTLGRGTPNGPENPTQWNLLPRPVGYLESKQGRFTAVRESNATQIPAGFPAAAKTIPIPPNTSARFLLDTHYEVTAYPEIIVSGGNNSVIKLHYTETLLDIDKDDPHKWHKTDRDVVAGKKLVGVHDVFVTDGGKDRTFIPLWMRVFRYVLVEIETKDEPLLLQDIAYKTTRYPFTSEASFTSNDPIHQPIVDACLRTIQLASQETYLDPYYEQMQYIGDTRIQALYGYYHFSDDRLSRNAIEQFNWSRSPEGITMSRYPSDLPQYTPLFALCWMMMVNDHWMLRQDDAFVKKFIPGMLGVLNWFEGKINDEGMLGNLPYLDFLDSKYERNDILKQSKSKSLTPYSLFYVYAIQQLGPFFKHFGKAHDLSYYEGVANKIKDRVILSCFDNTKKLFAENTDKRQFSQHSNIMAVLTGCVPAKEQQQFMKNVMTDTSLIQVSLYFKFYQFEALRQAGMGEEILNNLGDWKAMLANNMHTFSEWLTDPRSECHSWSAYPSYYFLNTIAGIQPAEPGFKTILIEPHLGKLTSIDATMPHPNGAIQLSIKKKGSKWNITAQLPAGIPGVFKWNGKSYDLKAGEKTVMSL